MNNIEWIGNKEIDSKVVNELLENSIKSRRFTNYGPNVSLLENIIKDKFKVSDEYSIIVVNNGSVAIHALTQSIALYSKMDIKWATQSFTFPPSAQGNLQDIEIVDIDNEGGLDLKYIDNNVNGLIVTNVFGNVVDIDRYVDYCNTNNKFLIFDNAATSYTFYKNKNCVNYGDGCTISFHHTKPFGFGEGGAIIALNKYESIIRKLINFGIDGYDSSDRFYNKYGNNHKMSDIAAVYIIQYLNNFDNIVLKYTKLYEYFKMKIINKKYKLFPSKHDNIIIPACFPILFETYNDNIKTNLLNNGIFCKKYYIPLKNTPVAMSFYNMILCIPCNMDMEISHIDKIINIIEKTE